MYNSVLNRYGAYELKSKYQLHLLLGQLVVIFIVAAAVGTGWLYLYFNPVEMQQVIKDEDRGWGHFNPIPPPIIKPDPPRIGGAPPGGRNASFGIPEPIEDSLANEEEAMIPPRDEPFYLTGPGTDSNHNGAYDGSYEEDNSGSGYIPPPDTFVSLEQQPMQAHEEIPEYPRIARDAGLEAVVIIRAFINNEGKVIKAEAVKCSCPGVGFEEAAVEAAYKCVYRPAIQNGHPVGVWVTYRVKFTVLQ